MADAVTDVSARDFRSEVLESDVPVVVDFWAPWCGPCRVVAPEVGKLAAQYAGRVKFVKMNIDENRETAIEYGVMSIPTIARFQNGKLASTVVGARKAADLGRELGLG